MFQLSPQVPRLCTGGLELTVVCRKQALVSIGEGLDGSI